MANSTTRRVVGGHYGRGAETTTLLGADGRNLLLTIDVCQGSTSWLHPI